MKIPKGLDIQRNMNILRITNEIPTTSGSRNSVVQKSNALVKKCFFFSLSIARFFCGSKKVFIVITHHGY